MTKVSYAQAENKKKIREFLFSFFKQQTSIVGLAGPDINDYLEWCKKKGYTNIEVWEDNPKVMMKQLSEIKTEFPVTYKFGDILSALHSDKVVYDLDFCSTILTLYNHVKKFKQEKFIMTFCTRAVGNEETIRKFFKERKEKVTNRIEKFEPVHHYSIQTQFGKYIVAPYFDTTPMLCIAKI